jgi:hypothetical protein
MRPRIVLTAILSGAIVMPPALGGAPAAVKLSLPAGASLESVLATLNASGFRVLYSTALVRPEMRLQTAPVATRIDELLSEILSPWKLRAHHAANGDWLIVADPAVQTRTQIPEHAAPEDLESVDVTASRLRLATAGVSQTFLDREDVQRLPHLGDDALRMLKILPGVSGGDISAAMNIRGGRRDEALLSIDGAEIHNAFHFRDIDGAFSVLDTNLVQGVEFTTGGMTAEYGDYMSGVVGLQSRRPRPDDEYRHQFGVSFVSAFGRSTGTFSDGRGSWLASARRGFLDVLTAQVEEGDERLTPRYTDVFGALDFDFSDRTRVAARLLVSEDDLRFRISDDFEATDSSGKARSTHVWAVIDHDWSDSFHMKTLVSAAQMNQTRASSGNDEHRDSSVRSNNDFSFFDLRQDWSWTLGERNLPRWGLNVSRQRGDYDYALDSTIFDPLITSVPIDTVYATRKYVHADKFGAYASWRTRIVSSLTGEAGARWDRYGYSGGFEFDAVSPRLNLVYELNGASELRAAWGIVYQPQGVHELQVEDNISSFFRPERSEQIALGYARHFDHGVSLRLDLYRKSYEHLRPYFDNLLGSIQLIPEAATDRVRIDAPAALAKGVEATLRREASRGIAGWVSLAIARVEERESGRWVPRGWDQRTTVTFGSSWTGQKWNLSLAGVFHDGTPITYFGIEAVQLPGGGSEFVGVVGPRNGDRLGSYTRIDLRANREVRLANSRLSFYLEVTNLLNTKNQSGFEDYGLEQDSQGQPVFWRTKDYWLPMLPSFGFQYEF